MFCVEVIHSVGTINSVQTSYFTQLTMLPNDNVSMSVGHLDHVLIVYSSMEHVTWKSPGRMEHKKEVDSFTAGTQTRASRARESSVTHKSAITDDVVEENNVIDWDKAKVVDREAQRQARWIKEALWIRKRPTCMNRDA